jgi:tetratricopeptide (TPR) repeat protein
MRFCFLFLSALTLAACASLPRSTESQRRQARPYFEMGIGHYNDRNYPQSLEAFEEAARIAPRDPGIEMHRALALYAVGRDVQGIDLMRKSCGLQDPFPECWNNLSYLFLKSGRHSEAREAAETALQTATYSSPWLAHSNRGLALHALGRHAEAIDAFKSSQASSRSAANCWTQLYLSRSHLALANFTEALRYARVGRDLCEMEARAHFWLAYVRFKVGDMASARDTLTEILQVFRDAHERDRARSALNQLNREEPLAEPELFL